MIHGLHASLEENQATQREGEICVANQHTGICDNRESRCAIDALQRKINSSEHLKDLSDLQERVNQKSVISAENSKIVQRTINIDAESNDRVRVIEQVQSLVGANPKVKEMDDGNPVVRVKMVRHDEPQGHRGFTRYEGDGLYIELEEPAVDGINLRETLHHELLNHGYKMFKHLESRSDMSGLGKMWDRMFPGYVPSELVDHMAYISETVDKAFGHNIIDQWFQDVDTTFDIMDDRLDWMVHYLDRFLEHVLERKFQIFGILNGSEEGRDVMEQWGIDTDGNNPHDDIEAALRKETELRKADVRSTVPQLKV